MTRVLVVEDEPQLLRALVLNLTARGYDVATASTARTALAEVDDLRPDLLVLDLGLPDKDGTEVIRELSSTHPELPIVVLSARTGSHEKVTALDLGAVDYVTKPFDMNELVARLRAAQRRASGHAFVSAVQMGELRVDFAAHTVVADNGENIRLTRTEWRLLEVLLRQPGRLVFAHELLTAVPNHYQAECWIAVGTSFGGNGRAKR